MSTDSRATQTSFEFTIIGHDISSNALGRAISMALVAKEIGPTRLLAFGQGKTWAGSSQFDVEILRLPRRWKRELSNRVSRKDDVRSVVWLSKGMAPLDRVAKYIRRKFPRAVVILDLDDDDAGLAEAFVGASMLNQLKLNRFRRGHPKQIRRAQSQIAGLAQGFTFSSYSLSSIFPGEYSPRTRIPHVRTDVSNQETNRRRSSDGIRFGSLGTLRPHKGSTLLLNLMRSSEDLTLVSFANCGLGAPETSDKNWIEIPPGTPLHMAYQQIDVSVIPITDNGSGAQFQLPAKLIDSMRSGVPVLASPTPAIEEIASGAYTPLDPESTLEEIVNLVKSLPRSDSGARGRTRFEELLTPSAASKALISLLGQAHSPGFRH